jgi:hypothetical protein
MYIMLVNKYSMCFYIYKSSEKEKNKIVISKPFDIRLCVSYTFFAVKCTAIDSNLSIPI